jgi:hypothetical protein
MRCTRHRTSGVAHFNSRSARSVINAQIGRLVAPARGWKQNGPGQVALHLGGWCGRLGAGLDRTRLLRDAVCVRLILAVATALAGLLWGVSAAWADDSITLAPPKNPPVAGQVTRVAIGVSVDSSFPGGTLEVHLRASGDCAPSPKYDFGASVQFVHGNAVGAGPLTLDPTTSGLVALMTFSPGQNLICAWLVDSSGSVVTEQDVRVVPLPGNVPRGWNPQTGACRSLTRSEVSRALGVKTVVSGGAGGLQTGTQTAFELADSSLCVWQAPSGMPTLRLFLEPEPTRATLARLLHVTGGPKLGSRDCTHVAGVGSDACWGGSNIYAVQGRLGLTFTIDAVLTTGGGTWTFARIEAAEVRLAREVFVQVAWAKK